MNKGQASTIEIFFIVASIAISVVIIWVVFNRILGDLETMTSITSADSLSKDLSSAIAVASTSPGNVKITYKTPEDVSLNLDIKNKNMEMEKLGKSGRVVKDSLLGVPSNIEANLENVNQVVIEKTRESFVISGGV